MKTLNTLFGSIAASVALLALPVASRADADAAMDACVQAFVSANLPKDQPVSVRKIDTIDGPLAVQDRAYRIVLTATGKTSGKKLARATCIVARDGQIVALNGRSPAPRLASR
jgi:hypothetical protein